MKYQVLLFYKYVTIPDPLLFKVVYQELCTRHNLVGRTILAKEGINSTLEGTIDNTENFLVEFLANPLFSDIQIKRSHSSGTSFPRLSIKVRNEIVATRLPEDVDPQKETATHLSPEELHSWYENNKDFVVVDMRNSYEFESGHFKNSIDPGMTASRELPSVVEKIREETKGKTVLTVCTGGVRCEKMSAYLLHKGFESVYQLDGGMHTYMEKYPGKNFLGTLFTFDDRLVMDFGGEREIIGTCKRCSKKTETYQNCANATCNMLFLICNDCVVTAGAGFCGEMCEASPSRVVNRIRG